MQCNKLGVMDQILHFGGIHGDKMCGNLGTACSGYLLIKVNYIPTGTSYSPLLVLVPGDCCLLQHCRGTSVAPGRNSAVFLGVHMNSHGRVLQAGRHRSRAMPEPLSVLSVCFPSLISTTAHVFILETILAEWQGFTVL